MEYCTRDSDDSGPNSTHNKEIGTDYFHIKARKSEINARERVLCFHLTNAALQNTSTIIVPVFVQIW